MKRFLIILPLLLSLSTQAQRISWSFIDIPLPDVMDKFNNLQKKYEIRTICDETEEEISITMQFENVTLIQALELIHRCYPMTYSIEGNIIHVETLKKSPILYEGTIIGNDRKPVQSAIVTLYSIADSIPLRRTISDRYGIYTSSCYEDSVLIRITHPTHDTLWVKATQNSLGKLVMNEQGKDAPSTQTIRQGYSHPAFPGGDRMLTQFIRETASYPDGIKGQKDFNAVVELLIDEEGTAVFGKMRSPSNDNEQIIREVKRVIKAMPTWEPARSVFADGKSVPEKSVVELTIPFTRQNSIGLDGTSIIVDKAGTLAQRLTQAQMDTCKSLSVGGPINSTDILTLRRMAGGDGSKGHLERLNLSHAKIITDKDTPYLTLDMEKEMANVIVYERGPNRDKTQFKAYTPMFMGTQNNIRHYNESTPRLMAATDKSTPTYTINHSPGWVGSYQNELRYMEEAGHWNAVVVLNSSNMREKQAVNSNGLGQNITDDILVNPDIQSFKWTRMQQKAMRKLKGQYVVNENGRYIYKSYTRNNNFCLDMFYECPALKIVVLPNGIQPNGNVYVAGSPIKYY